MSNINFQLFLCWLLVLASTFIFKQRTSAESLAATFDMINIARGGMVIVAFSLLLLLLSLRKVKISPIPKPLKFFFYYSLFALVSVFWSWSPVVTYAKSQEIFVAILIVSIAHNVHGSLLLLERMWKAILFIILLLIAHGVFGYALGLDGFYAFHSRTHHILRGQLMSPLISYGGFSLYGAILTILFAHKFILYKKKKFLFLSLFFSSICLLSLGRTSIVGMLLGIIVLLLIKFGGKFINFIKLSFIPVLIFLLFFWFNELMIPFFMRGQSLDELRNLSGRLDMWQVMSELITESPYLGYGFGVGSRVAFSTIGITQHEDTISSAHNGFLEVFSGVGLIGLFLWLLAIYSAVKYLINNRFGKYSSLLLSLMPLYLLVSTFNILLGGWLSVPMAIFFILTALSCNENEHSISP